MEATTTREAEGLVDKIRPPRLEDAGLEDCALPPDSIKEAFFKAAAAVGSRAASVFSTSEEEEGGCVHNPWPNEAEESADALVGIREGIDPPPGACAAEKGGGLPEVMGDEVAVGLTDAEERATDKVVDGKDVAEEGGGGEACVDGLQGLKIGDKGKSGGDEGEEEEEEEEEGGERPILVETLI